MRRDSLVVQKCTQKMTALGYQNYAFQKAKLILKIYPNVVWMLSERSQELQEYACELGGRDLEAGLSYLAGFAPNMDVNKFEEQVCCVMESKLLIEVVDRALIRLKNYPERGELYFEILSKQYVNRFRYTEKEMLDVLGIERSVFYDRKKEAIYLFTVCLFGYTLPELREESGIAG